MYNTVGVVKNHIRKLHQGQGKCTLRCGNVDGENFGKCLDGQCCSKKGYCGTSSGFCSTSLGCQANYGKCIKDRYGASWGSCPDGQCCNKKAKSYDNSKYEEIIDFLKLYYENPKYLYGFYWLLRARSRHKIDTSVAKTIKFNSSTNSITIEHFNINMTNNSLDSFNNENNAINNNVYNNYCPA
ncbi:carbohydrate-binding module family 18 protein [Piromyces sp. E2]|nr:carbohydrate-binding module family 18 protein [Piromyces sp. E2]|eukprot:OUM57192.1 carbohydrate-binding module family 18 protein [Piromyces sp. E2]